MGERIEKIKEELEFQKKIVAGFMGEAGSDALSLTWPQRLDILAIQTDFNTGLLISVLGFLGWLAWSGVFITKVVAFTGLIMAALALTRLGKVRRSK